MDECDKQNNQMSNMTGSSHHYGNKLEQALAKRRNTNDPENQLYL